MKILFAGWNINGEKCLLKLIENGFNISHVVVPSEKQTKPIEQIARKYSLNCLKSSNESHVIDLVKNKNIDLVISASCTIIFGNKLLKLPPKGAINIHTSKLPQYCGVHPLNWAIINDEKEVGVTVHYMNDKVDLGDIIEQATIQVENTDTINSILDRITDLGADILLKAVQKIQDGKVTVKPQNPNQVSYARKRTPDDGLIKWNKNSRDIFNLIRALESPYPNAFTYNQNGEKIYIKRLILFSEPGRVIDKLDDFYLITTGDGLILVETDKKLNVGEKLGNKPTHNFLTNV